MEQPAREMLGFQIKTISEMMSQRMTNALTSLDLTSSQAFVLRYLCRQTEQGAAVYPRDVERIFQLAHPTVSGLLQRLEAKGFLTLEPAPEDRRCKQIVPTDRARQVNQQLRSQLQAEEQQLVLGMTDAEVARLRGYLLRMIHNISPARGCSAPAAEDAPGGMRCADGASPPHDSAPAQTPAYHARRLFGTDADIPWNR